MMIVNSPVIKKGIEIPELVFEVLPENIGIKVLAIDKIKYADWLALGQKIFGTFTNDVLTNSNTVDYIGDETSLFSVEEGYYLYGISGTSNNVQNY